MIYFSITLNLFLVLALSYLFFKHFHLQKKVEKDEKKYLIPSPAARQHWLMSASKNVFREKKYLISPLSVKQHWVTTASKNISSIVKFHLDQNDCADKFIPAPFPMKQITKKDSDYEFCIANKLISKYPIWKSGLSIQYLHPSIIRTLSDGCAVDGAINVVGYGGLSLHEIPVGPEGESYRVALNARAKEFGYDYTFRFDKTKNNNEEIDIKLDLSKYSIQSDGTLIKNINWEGEGLSEKHRNLIVQIDSSLDGFKTKSGELDWDWINFVGSLSFVKGFEIVLHHGGRPNIKRDKSNLIQEAKILGQVKEDEEYKNFSLILSEELPKQIDQLGRLISSFRDLTSFKDKKLVIGIKTVFSSHMYIKNIARLIKVKHGPDYLHIEGNEASYDFNMKVMAGNFGHSIKHSIREVDKILRSQNVRNDITLIASGDLIDPMSGARAMCYGADLIGSGRAAIIAVDAIREDFEGGKELSLQYKNYIEHYRFELLEIAKVLGVDLLSGGKMLESMLTVD